MKNQVKKQVKIWRGSECENGAEIGGPGEETGEGLHEGRGALALIMNQPGKRITRIELYEAVWSKTFKALAQEWNTTHEQLLKACRTMNVPRPNQRYWPAISWGHRVGRKPLPRRNRKTPGEVLLPPRGRSRSALAAEPRSDSEVLRTLAASAHRHERVQERFRGVVVKGLAQLEARVRVLQADRILDSVRLQSEGMAKVKEASYESLVSEVSEELERRMFGEMSGGRVGRSQAAGSPGRGAKWSDWEI